MSAHAFSHRPVGLQMLTPFSCELFQHTCTDRTHASGEMIGSNGVKIECKSEEPEAHVKIENEEQCKGEEAMEECKDEEMEERRIAFCAALSLRCTCCVSLKL